MNDEDETLQYIDILEREVNNGGFHQFFYNSSGEYAHEIFSAYKKIGSKEITAIIERAINKFPKFPVPKNWKLRQDILLEKDSYFDLWNDLDDEYYKCSENITELKVKYSEKNNVNLK